MRSITKALILVAGSIGALAGGCGDDSDSGSAGAGNSGNSSSELEGAISEDFTVTADREWILRGVVTVEDGATLTIEAGTTIMGDKTTNGTLVVKQGGKLVANGTAEEPIVFTSRLPEGERAAGDWGGVILLGRAPINGSAGTASIEGLSTDEVYGGSDSGDSSGSLSYVRIEFSGTEISPDNEINGLTMGGVGSGTSIDHIMVRHTLDDCFEFFGGTVNASHLICYRNGDDGFDFDQGYVGNLQFLFLQQDPTVADSANGFEADNDGDNPDATPVTNPTIYNATLVGQNTDLPKEQFGMLLRRGFNATIGNIVVTGFEAGVDIRDKPFTAVTLSHAHFFGNAPENIAYVEDGSNEEELADDDEGFDEMAWFLEEETNSVEGSMTDAFAAEPKPFPSATMAGGTPPDNGFFDTTADFVGAFKDADDDWMQGAWTDWSAN